MFSDYFFPGTANFFIFGGHLEIEASQKYPNFSRS